MGGVFAAAAQAPLTAIASVAEMTGNFTLTLPIMLASGIASALSKRLTYGSIYTTKLLRRGIDIERPRPTGALQRLTVEDAMQPLTGLDGRARLGRVAARSARHGGPRTRAGSNSPTTSRASATRRSCSPTKRSSKRCASSCSTATAGCP